MHDKPFGYAEDHVTLRHIYEDEPSGEGAIGELVDEWFLNHPACMERRAAQERAYAPVAKQVETDASSRVCALASGVGLELLDCVEQNADSQATFLCMDWAPEALRDVAAESHLAGRPEVFSFLCVDVETLNQPGVWPDLDRQQLIYAHGLTEYLADEALEQLLDWAWHALGSGGKLVLDQVSATLPDQDFLHHVIRWPMVLRTSNNWREVVQKSPFSGQCQIEDKGHSIIVEGWR